MIKADINQNLQRLIGLRSVRSVQYHETIDSTNEAAMEFIAQESSSDGVLIIAGMQNKGRGRLGKDWISPKGGIYFSLIMDSIYPGWFSLIVAMAVSRSLEMQKCTGTRIKWPNDILFHKKKLAGILIQTTSGKTVIGIGINAFEQDKIELDTAIAIGPFTISERFDIIKRTILNLEEMLDEIEEHGFPHQKDRLLKKMAFMNDKVQIIDGNDIFTGEFIGLADDGAIIIKDGGLIRRFISGSLFYKG